MSLNVPSAPTGSVHLLLFLIALNALIPFVQTVSKNLSRIIPIKSFVLKIFKLIKSLKSSSINQPKKFFKDSSNNIKILLKTTIYNASNLSQLLLINSWTQNKSN